MNKNKVMGYVMLVLGFILILANAIDYFVPGKALTPGLTIIGLMLVVVGMFISKEK